MESKNDLVGHKVPPAHLIVRGIDKRFGGLQALKDADFEVARGEVMALVGDNGAGKSTLMKVLAGAYSADAGDFFLDGKRVSIKSPNDASALGIQILWFWPPLNVFPKSPTTLLRSPSVFITSSRNKWLIIFFINLNSLSLTDSFKDIFWTIDELYKNGNCET